MLKKIEEVVPDALCSVIGPLLSGVGFESLENGCVDTMSDFLFHKSRLQQDLGRQKI